MPYTTLRVTERGVVLFDLHARRLAAAGAAAQIALQRFAASATPGVYAIWAEAREFRVEARPGSRLVDGMPVRFLPSPFAEPRGSWRGPFAKPASPCAYDALRTAGIATLLTSHDGAEIFESCSAAVLGWDGSRFLCVPRDRPRVESTAETAVREHLATLEMSLRADEAIPLVLVNAVKGPCTVAVPGRAPVPDEVIQQLEALFSRLVGGRD